MSYPQQDQQNPGSEQQSFLSSNTYGRDNAFQMYLQLSPASFLRPDKWINGYLRYHIVGNASGQIVVESIQEGGSWTTVATLPFTVTTPSEFQIIEDPNWNITTDDLALRVTGTGTDAIMVEYRPVNRQ